MTELSGRHIHNIVRRALNRVDDRLVDHGERVAYLVMHMLLEEGSCDARTIRNVSFVALLHDIGAYKTEEIDNMLRFEIEQSWNHSIYGYLFLKYLSPFRSYAPVVLFHHTPYVELEAMNVPLKELAECVSLADRVDVFMEQGAGEHVLEVMEAYRGTKFSPKWLDLLKQAEQKKGILEKLSGGLFMDEVYEAQEKVPLSKEEIDVFLKMIIFAIDFRSRYTVIHTITTTSISRQLAVLFGFDEEKTDKVRQGALLHDLGKIGIPVEILEFPGKLSPQAMKIMRTHVDITEEIMGGEIEEEITRIALRHHEKLDGSGYPRGLRDEDMTMGEKIVAIADIVSALTGERSYKVAFDKKKTVRILREMKEENLLCPYCVEMMISHFDEIMRQVGKTGNHILNIYNIMQLEYEELARQYAYKGRDTNET
ncbi:HD domain-containing phosphohydrolase [Diplocloster agilis]|uniref:HD domain-containing phosphohydrolase n=1 Tax=Diplocloster agilis TaxID=2850323 RepID=UPI000822ABB4|nr:MULTISPECIES: HD domain-containing phosphohydrolase [Lachnospiraceae]MBU9743247.1 HD domain-containing protein [Diplocloster agilis]MCU6732839.1 HD domain-containing protein [Suonthocola fibrivorans]SCI64810.1 Cyclic di-GMP phosphodiesterase response regulator RpfG [uncultured Clostridium sp.]